MGVLPYAFAMWAMAAPSTATVTIPKLDEPPTIDDFVDSERAAARAPAMARLDQFVQRAPDDGAAATERTEVYLGYTARNLYVIFVAHDSQASRIRARLGRRESFTIDEDQVGIYLDTFNDRRWAYQFSCNAVGVQDDSVYTEDSGTWDESFDTVWESRGIVTDG